jgi:hypothetical protein
MLSGLSGIMAWGGSANLARADTPGYFVSKDKVEIQAI